MGLFDTEEGVSQYEEMADGYDGRELVDRLRELVPAGATVLELGMGPGKDLDMLLETYDAVGSDSSSVFLDRYRSRKGDDGPELLELDAETLATDRTFDAIYSNKVIMHLTRDACRRSLARQAQVLRPGGVAMHALWLGDKEDEEHGGVHFTYYTADSFRKLLPETLELVEHRVYAEMDEDDSLWVVLKKQPGG